MEEKLYQKLMAMQISNGGSGSKQRVGIVASFYSQLRLRLSGKSITLPEFFYFVSFVGRLDRRNEAYLVSVLAQALHRRETESYT